MKANSRQPLTALLLTSALLGGCAHNSAYQPLDPLEPFNRQVFALNMNADKYVLRPAAVGYRYALPSFVRQGIGNVISNFLYPRVILHDLLQGQFAQSGKDLGRFALNSTLGLAGIVDVASSYGLQENDEDLGQTLAVWGVGEGYYLMLPFLGPSTGRDFTGTIGDIWTSPMQYIDGVGWEESLAFTAVDAIDTRSELLDADAILRDQLDPYVFVRTAYLQSREAAVRNGKPPEDEFDYGFALPEE